MTGRQALVVFYGIYWATTATVIGRYRLFETHLLSSGDRGERNRAIRRLVVGMAIMNFGPILWFLLLYGLVPASTDAWALLAAAVASLSVFGFHRVLHGLLVASSGWRFFYEDEERDAILAAWGRPNVGTAQAHILPGLGFLMVFGGLAALATLVSN